MATRAQRCELKRLCYVTLGDFSQLQQRIDTVRSKREKNSTSYWSSWPTSLGHKNKANICRKIATLQFTITI